MHGVSILWVFLALLGSRAVFAGSPIVVAVVDTGIEFSHPSLSPNLWTNELEARGASGVDDDGNGYIDDVHGYNFVDHQGDAAHQTVNDHGTHVAGIALRSFRTQAGAQIQLMSINVFGSQIFSSPIEAMSEGIRYAARMGAHVINISATSRGSSLEYEGAIRDAVSWGSLVVVAAGNDSADLDQEDAFPASYGARYPEVISVAALDLRTHQLCGRSSFGARTVLLAAPGCDNTAPNGGIWSARRGGKFGYKSGTSMAAPWVAGGIAAWLETQPDTHASGLQVRSWLGSVTQPMTELLGKVGSGGASLPVEPFSNGR